MILPRALVADRSIELVNDIALSVGGEVFALPLAIDPAKIKSRHPATIRGALIDRAGALSPSLLFPASITHSMHNLEETTPIVVTIVTVCLSSVIS
ncbi:MAG: hypothetical protein R2845_09605 [Thermomicrobiales bacterium]